jgi:geranylgeranyl diphosphate synthase type II
VFNLDDYLAERRRWVDEELNRSLPAAGTRPRALHEAMRYAVLAGGKRLRPILCLAATEAVGAHADAALVPALALELFHTYTLIHDDLPAMDDDALRRGKPTCHIVYGEANAILAGDALLTLAFQWLAETPAPPPHPTAQLVSELAKAGGHLGVVAGQVEDLAAEGQPATAQEIEYIHRHKTAALIRAAVRIGGIAGRADADALAALSTYGDEIGLAFQIADDLLNHGADPATLGKATGSDAARRKATYVALLGPDETRRLAEARVAQAIAALAGLPGRKDPLEALARHVIARDR